MKEEINIIVDLEEDKEKESSIVDLEKEEESSVCDVKLWCRFEGRGEEELEKGLVVKLKNNHRKGEGGMR
ncbi:hypothetical protein FNV43_RR03577 [Rhamnella rubrinervis]|uniref:Uncharacterized protein n=1 Tax=Rhamnella rubrinervis TaxID=2594499 RepID=A0A8K0MP05_9ROSA|nr:hypothetical protein FNV43_RR03577 [Rhamnella rubrinervis]